MKTEEIKQIQIKDIIDRLGLKYFSKGNMEFGLYDGDGKTSGWSFNTSKNIVTDFSKDRPDGDTFGFVKKYLKLDDTNTFKWFEENFITKKDKEQQQKPIRVVWEGLNECNQKQIDYITKRKIDYEKIKDIVKDYNGGIACLLYKWDTPKGLRSRAIEGQSRFFSASGYDGNGIYQYELDETKEYLIVVEGLFDFLTLRQFYPNVIGLGSAKVGFEEVKRLSQKYKIIFCPDNDEAGKESIKHFDGIRYSLFDISKYSSVKDMNDLYCEYDIVGEGIIKMIIDESKPIIPIQKTFDKLQLHINTIRQYGKLGIDGPKEIGEIYKQTSGVIKGKVYTIGAYSNIGKSKFMYYHIQDFLRKGLKCLVISLEVAEEMCLQEIAHSMYIKTLKDDLENTYKINIKDFENLEIRDDMFDLDKILEYIEFSKCDICFIDFSQNIQVKGSKGYEKNAEIAIGIQRTAIKTGSTIFQLSQISNEMAKTVNQGMETTVSLKGAGEYYSSSDVIFLLRRGDNQGELVLKIEKNKFGFRDKEYLLGVDYSTNRFYIKDQPF